MLPPSFTKQIDLLLATTGTHTFPLLLVIGPIQFEFLVYSGLGCRNSLWIDGNYTMISIACRAYVKKFCLRALQPHSTDNRSMGM